MNRRAEPTRATPRRQILPAIALFAGFALLLLAALDILDSRQNILDFLLSVDGRPSQVQLLLRLGANPNSRGYGGDALVDASSNGNLQVVKLLLAAGADPNLPNSGSEVPLTWAVLERHADVVRVLLAAGADPNGSPEYNDEMLTAATPDIIRMLRQSGAKYYGDAHTASRVPNRRTSVVPAGGDLRR